MARPAKKTEKKLTDFAPKTKAKLLEAFRNDLTDEQACFEANVSPSVYYEVRRNDRKLNGEDSRLSQEIDQAKNNLKVKAKFNIGNSINKGDIELSKWQLERREKENYSPRHEMTGADGEKLIDLPKEKKEELDKVLKENK